jgi:hypothetical protein
MSYDASASTVKKVLLSSLPVSGHIVDVYSAYGALTSTAIQSAITAASTNATTLLLKPGTWVVSADLTFGSNITVRFMHGAILQIADTKTVTFIGPIEAGLYQIFSDQDATNYDGVKFNDGAAGSNVHIEAIYPQWWGAAFNCSDEDCATGDDDRDEWQCALNSLPLYGGIIKHTGGRSKVGSTLIWPVSGTTGIPITIQGNNHVGSTTTADSVDAGSSQIVFTGSRALFDCRGGTTSALGTQNYTWKGRLENISLMGPYRFDWNYVGVWTANTAYGAAVNTTYVIPRGAVGATNYAQAIAAKAARTYFQATTPGNRPGMRR